MEGFSRNLIPLPGIADRQGVFQKTELPQSRQLQAAKADALWKGVEWDWY
jgi:hypothetical protein